MPRARWVLVPILMLLGSPSVSHAQQPLAALLVDLLNESTVNRTAPSNQPGGVHEPHFLVGLSQELAPFEVNRALGFQLTTFPLPSSSGGFTYSVNPDTGEVTPTSTTFGPSFAERGLTIGRGQFNFGVSFQNTRYSSFEGVDLEDGGLRFFMVHSDCCPVGGNRPTQTTDLAPDFERDLLRVDLAVELKSRTTAFYANYGVTDHFDVGVAIPFVNVDVSGTTTTTIQRTGSSSNTLIHSFDGQGLSTLTNNRSGSATGLGDILVRAKYNFYRGDSGAFAGALDLRLPTGDDDDLLGLGAAQSTIFVAGSTERGVFSPYVNVGYTFSTGEGSAAARSFVVDPNRVTTSGAQQVTGLAGPSGALDIPDEFMYAGGVNVAVHPRLTAAFDLRGRMLRDVNRFEATNVDYPNRGAGALPTATFVGENELVIRGTENLNLVLGFVGAKVNVAGRLLINGGVLFPLTDGGLKSKVTPVIGFDYVFGR